MPLPPPFGADEYVTATEPLSLLRLLKGDLRHGRNLDLYIVVGIAVVVATLGVFSVVDSRILAAATLTVLAMMATSTLASRHQVDGVRTTLVRMAASEAGNVPAERFLSQRHVGLDAEVATATHIGLVGVTLTRTIRDLLPILDRRLQAGARVRVLLIELESQAHQEAVARSKKADAPDFYRHRVSSTVDLLRVLASTAADQSALQLRVLPFVPTFGMCMIDPGERHGRIYVEVYQHRTLEPNPLATNPVRETGRLRKPRRTVRALEPGNWRESVRRVNAPRVFREQRHGDPKVATAHAREVRTSANRRPGRHRRSPVRHRRTHRRGSRAAVGRRGPLPINRP